MPWIRLICLLSIAFILARQGISMTSWTFLELMGLICLISLLSYEEGKPSHALYRVSQHKFPEGEKDKYKLLPVIDSLSCDGCNKCIDACGVKGLESQNGIAFLTNPDICISDGTCSTMCPVGAIKMQWVKMPVGANMRAGQWRLPY